jgi:hypothetical protein
VTTFRAIRNRLIAGCHARWAAIERLRRRCLWLDLDPGLLKQIAALASLQD